MTELQFTAGIAVCYALYMTPQSSLESTDRLPQCGSGHLENPGIPIRRSP
jgi:hypothetical protein